MTKRKYISIYFNDAVILGKKKGYLTLAFSNDDSFYKKCKKLGSGRIKQILAVSTYADLVEKASNEGRSLGNYIKFVLRKKL